MNILKNVFFHAGVLNRQLPISVKTCIWQFETKILLLCSPTHLPWRIWKKNLSRLFSTTILSEQFPHWYFFGLYFCHHLCCIKAEDGRTIWVSKPTNLRNCSSSRKPEWTLNTFFKKINEMWQVGLINFISCTGHNLRVSGSSHFKLTHHLVRIDFNN